MLYSANIRYFECKTLNVAMLSHASTFALYRLILIFDVLSG